MITTEAEARQGDILIVDDVPENLQLLFTMLTDQGYDVRRVTSGEQALKVIEIDPPDLILLDIKMPGLNGYEVCEILKANEKTQQIPVIFLSALNDAFDKVRAFEVGGVDYINKPFQLPEVLIRVENQLQLLRTQQQLAQKNRELVILNQELESFSYSVAHDLRNPLTTILGFSDILKSKYDNHLHTEEKHLFDLIHDASLQMQQIIEDLLRLSQVKYLEMEIEDIHLSQLVADSLNDLKSQKQATHLHLDIMPFIFTKGDENLLKIAIDNLCSNAWKYSQKNPEPLIEFGRIEPESQTETQLQQSDQVPVYYLKDNGVGFEMTEATELFVPFHRLHSKEEFEGTGIGLTIVQRIIERHHGKIWYDAQVNEGATFYFTLNC